MSPSQFSADESAVISGSDLTFQLLESLHAFQLTGMYVTMNASLSTPDQAGAKLGDFRRGMLPILIVIGCKTDKAL